MKDSIKNRMLKTKGIYYTWYRFSKQSNYVTFAVWAEQYVEGLKPSEVDSFVKRNRLESE